MYTLIQKYSITVIHFVQRSSAHIKKNVIRFIFVHF
jgi:hypothetical protein